MTDEDVADGHPDVAAFDFDGTLTSGGSVWPFLREMTGSRRVAATATSLVPQFVAAVVIGGHLYDSAKEAVFRRTLGGMPIDDVVPRAREFGLRHYARHARADVRERLEWHRARGDLLVIISASPELYVGPVGEELRVDAVIATRLEVVDGKLTGRYDGRNCRGAQKLERLNEWITDSVVRPRPDRARSLAAADGVGAQAPPDIDEAKTSLRPHLWAYGNSAGDSALLHGADVGVDVGRLGRFGRLRNFRRLSAMEAT